MRSDKASLVRHANNRNDADGWFALLEGGAAVGGIGCRLGEGVYKRSAQFGYWLGEACWGRGIMTAAVKAIVPYAMERLGLVRLESPVFEWNPASMRVLEKCGFTREAVLKASVCKDGQLIDSVLYAFIDPTHS